MKLSIANEFAIEQWQRILNGSLLSLSSLLLPSSTFLLMPDLSKLKKENPKKTAFMEYREMASKRKGKNIQNLSELGAFFKNIPLSRQGGLNRRR